jgi:hypothetical protein
VDLQVKVSIPVLALLACGLAGSVLTDVGRDVVYRTTWFEGVATVEEVVVKEDGPDLYRLSYQWRGTVRQAWTEREAGEPQPGDPVEVLIDEDDLDDVAMRGWAWDNRFNYLVRLAAAGLVGAGAFLLARRLWREPEPPRRILRPRGNPGPRQPAGRRKGRR